MIQTSKTLSIGYLKQSAFGEIFQTILTGLWLTANREGENSKNDYFFRKIDHIADVFEHLETSLGEQCYYSKNGTNDDRNRLFDMYLLKTDDEVKDSIASSYQKEDGNVRVVLCSTFF